MTVEYAALELEQMNPDLTPPPEAVRENLDGFFVAGDRHCCASLVHPGVKAKGFSL